MASINVLVNMLLYPHEKESLSYTYSFYLHSSSKVIYGITNKYQEI